MNNEKLSTKEKQRNNQIQAGNEMNGAPLFSHGG